MKKILETGLCMLLLFLLCSGAWAETPSMPTDLIIIEDEAFMGDQSLTSVILPDGLETIGRRAFAYTSLSAVTIPASVTTIGEEAFAGCSGLTIKGEPGSAAEAYAIENGIPYAYRESPLADFTFTDLTADTCEIMSYDGSAVFVVIPVKDGTGKSVAVIGNGAFYTCDLSGVYIPSSVVFIGEMAFYGCDSLTSVTISDGVTDIGDSAFSDCSGLTALTIPASVTNIGEDAFYGCDDLIITCEQGSAAHTYAIENIIPYTLI